MKETLGLTSDHFGNILSNSDSYNADCEKMSRLSRDLNRFDVLIEKNAVGGDFEISSCSGSIPFSVLVKPPSPQKI
jgi:hypothetical protein